MLELCKKEWIITHLFFKEGILCELGAHVLALTHSEGLRVDISDTLLFGHGRGQVLLDCLQSLDVLGVYNLIFSNLLIAH